MAEIGNINQAGKSLFRSIKKNYFTRVFFRFALGNARFDLMRQVLNANKVIQTKKSSTFQSFQTWRTQVSLPSMKY